MQSKPDSAHDYSVVVPVYNSSSTLVELYQRIETVFNKLEKSFEVIFVEDCGSDNSWETLLSLKKQNPNKVCIIRLSKNFGQHNAILCGLHWARGKHIITIDDDLQIPPEEIETLIIKAKATNADVVYGIYEHKKHSVGRNIGSNTIQFFFKQSFGNTNSITSFRLIRRNIIEQIIHHKQSFVFLDGLIFWYTKKVEYVLVTHLNRTEGVSGYNFHKLARLGFNLFFNYTTIPLRVATYTGLTLSFMSFVIGLIFIYRKLILSVPIGFTAIIVAVFFMGGITLLVLGIIGEYLARIYSLQLSKPQYSIGEIHDTQH